MKNSLLNERPACCDQPGCRNTETRVIETPNGRRWYFCDEHLQESA